MSDLVELRDVTKVIGGLTILNHLSLSLRQGEALGVLGPNGAGKTTMLNLIAGDMTPSSGGVFFHGEDVTQLAAHRRCRMGISRTYQIPRPFLGMTVFENVLVGAIYSRRNARAAASVSREVLTLTGLVGKHDELAENLGLLDRKRLELSRALATRPELVLLDEIGGGLTQPELRALLDVIGQVRARGITLIWIEHVVHALAAVDRILAIHFGTKLAEGPPADVVASKELREIYLGVE